MRRLFLSVLHRYFVCSQEFPFVPYISKYTGATKYQNQRNYNCCCYHSCIRLRCFLRFDGVISFYLAARLVGLVCRRVLLGRVCSRVCVRISGIVVRKVSCDLDGTAKESVEPYRGENRGGVLVAKHSYKWLLLCKQLGKCAVNLAYYASGIRNSCVCSELDEGYSVSVVCKLYLSDESVRCEHEVLARNGPSYCVK